MSMSIRQFARELGITHKAVQKAIKSERIPPEAVGTRVEGARTLTTIIEPDLAAKCYRAGTRHSKGHQAGAFRGNPETQKVVFAREMFRAKREQLAYEKEAGLVITRSKVLLAIHTAGESLKKIVAAKHRSALEKILQALKDAVDRQNEDGST